MATIKYFIRPGKKNPTSIYVRFKSGNEVDQTAKSGIHVRKENWSAGSQLLKQRAEISNKDTLNDKLKEIRLHIENEFNEVHDKSDPGKDWLKTTIEKYHTPEKFDEGVISLFSYVENFIKKSTTRINPKSGKPVSYKMRREYERTFYYIKAFCEEQNKEYDFVHMDLGFYQEFTEFLQKKGLAVNTIGKKIQTLKIFLNAAKDEGKNPYDRYRSRRFVAITEESDTIYLTEDELAKIAATDFSERPALERVRDLFIIGCWTGVRFSDLHKINPDNIKGDWIRIKQAKTGNKVDIPVSPIVLEIIDKYDGTLPKPISNQKFNEALKKVALLSEINDKAQKTITKGGITRTKAYLKWQLVTTHTARRSFATNLYKRRFSSRLIMKITGHKTEKSFLSYIRATDDDDKQMFMEKWREEKMHIKVV